MISSIFFSECSSFKEYIGEEGKGKGYMVLCTFQTGLKSCVDVSGHTPLRSLPRNVIPYDVSKVFIKSRYNFNQYPENKNAYPGD